MEQLIASCVKLFAAALFTNSEPEQAEEHPNKNIVVEQQKHKSSVQQNKTILKK